MLTLACDRPPKLDASGASFSKVVIVIAPYWHKKGTNRERNDPEVTTGTWRWDVGHDGKYLEAGGHEIVLHAELSGLKVHRPEHLEAAQSLALASGIELLHHLLLCLSSLPACCQTLLEAMTSGQILKMSCLIHRQVQLKLMTERATCSWRRQ